MSIQVVVTTNSPSPYQVELFDAVAAETDIKLCIIYARRHSSGRHWMVPQCHHDHVFIEDGAIAWRTAREWIQHSNCAVISCYFERSIRELLRQRNQSQRAWCLWGERPRQRWGRLGRLRRRIYLNAVATSRAPIWGIGRWAIDGWKAEFGESRQYLNVPYHSDLARFQACQRRNRSDARTVLYSGSLIHRKGVDLLAEAFVSVARKSPSLMLTVIGSGELRASMERTLAPVRSRVCFYGYRQWDELPDIYRTADVLCAPSRYDGWGLIVPEGLAAGLPVISTPQTGAALDLIRPSENGWIINHNSRDELESALCDVAVTSPENLRSMSQCAADTARQHSLENGVMRFREAVIKSIEWFSFDKMAVQDDRQGTAS